MLHEKKPPKFSPQAAKTKAPIFFAASGEIKHRKFLPQAAKIKYTNFSGKPEERTAVCQHLNINMCARARVCVCVRVWSVESAHDASVLIILYIIIIMIYDKKQARCDIYRLYL